MGQHGCALQALPCMASAVAAADAGRTLLEVVLEPSVAPKMCIEVRGLDGTVEFLQVKATDTVGNVKQKIKNFFGHESDEHVFLETGATPLADDGIMLGALGIVEGSRLDLVYGNHCHDFPVEVT